MSLIFKYLHDFKILSQSIFYKTFPCFYYAGHENAYIIYTKLYLAQRTGSLPYSIVLNPPLHTKNYFNMQLNNTINVIIIATHKYCDLTYSHHPWPIAINTPNELIEILTELNNIEYI